MNAIYNANLWYDDLETRGFGATRFLLFLVVLTALNVPIVFSQSPLAMGLSLLMMAALGLMRVWFFGEHRRRKRQNSL